MNLPLPAIGQEKPVRIGLLTVKTGPLAQGGIQMEQGISLFLKHRGNKLAGRTDRTDRCRYRRQSGRHQDKGAGTDRARPGRFHRRPARRLRTAGHQRLCRSAQVPDPESCRRRGYDPAQAQPVFRARFGDVGAADASARRLRPQGTEIRDRDHRRQRFRLRLRGDGRLPAGVRGCGRPGEGEAVAAARDARLYAFPRTDERGRRRCLGPRRLEPDQVHAAVQGPGAHPAGARRRRGDG